MSFRITKSLFQSSLFIGRLPYFAKKEQVADLFGSEYSIKHINLPLSSMEGQNKGYAFVDFEESSVVEKVIAKHQDTPFMMEGMKLNLDHSNGKKTTQRSQNSEPSSTLYVGNLPNSITDQDLKQVFPTSTSLTIVKDFNGDPRGFGFVEFQSTEDCKAALEESSSATIGDCTLKVSFKQSKQ